MALAARLLCSQIVFLWILLARGNFLFPSQPALIRALHDFETGCVDIDSASIVDLADAIRFKSKGHASLNGQNIQLAQSLVGACLLLLRQGKEQLQLLGSVSLGEERRLKPHEAKEYPWYANSQDHNVPFKLAAFVAIAVMIFLWEACCIRSTLVCKCAYQGVNAVSNEIKRERALYSSFLKGVRDSGQEHGFKIVENAKALAKAGRLSIGQEMKRKTSRCDTAKFWRKMTTHISGSEASFRDDQLRHIQAEHEGDDVITFARRSFAAFEEHGRATVTLQRHGTCKGIVVVHVSTLEDERKSALAARKGKHFHHSELDVRFEDGERYKDFDVLLLRSKARWEPTRSCLIELSYIISGKAKLQEPSAIELRNHGNRPTVVIHISQTEGFPGNLTEKQMSSWKSLVYSYFKYCASVRGGMFGKFGKCLFGMVYRPVHQVLVSFILKKALFDWAVNKKGGGSYEAILLMGGLYAVSSLIFRWADVAVCRNKSRSGLGRMHHRQQILTKMMMLEHSEHSRIVSTHWWYTALIDVDIVVKYAYWEALTLISNLVGLVMCLVALFGGVLVKHIEGKANITFSHYLDGVGVVIMIPIATVALHWRRPRIKQMLTRRFAAEEDWVNTLGWLCSASSNLYAISKHELTQIEMVFTEQCNNFRSHHTAFRDYMHDTSWIAQWIDIAFYVAFLCSGGFRLYQSLEAKTLDFQVGDYVVLLGIFQNSGKYLRKANTSIVKMHGAAVSIKRLADLLNLEELKSLHSTEQPILACEEAIEFKDVQLADPFGPMGAFAMLPNTLLTIPLGRIVLINGGNERSLLSIAALLAQVFYPSAGELSFPLHKSTLMLPPSPVDPPPYFLVRRSLQSAGASEQLADTLASALGLNPDLHVSCLGLAERQLLAIARTMIFDPDILVAVRPLGPLSLEHRKNISTLLRVWQAGGAALLLHYLDQCVDDASSTAQHPQHRGDTEMAPRRHRTLILAGGMLMGRSDEDDVCILVDDKLCMGAADEDQSALSDAKLVFEDEETGLEVVDSDLLSIDIDKIAKEITVDETLV